MMMCCTMSLRNANRDAEADTGGKLDSLSMMERGCIAILYFKHIARALDNDPEGILLLELPSATMTASLLRCSNMALFLVISRDSG